VGQVRHGNATITPAFRAAPQRPEAWIAQLSRELGINPMPAPKRRMRATVQDMKTGPTGPEPTALTETVEAIIVTFRRHALLPLDCCLVAPQPTIRHLTRSAPHPCLQRHHTLRLPEVEGDMLKRQKFKRYPIGSVSISTWQNAGR